MAWNYVADLAVKVGEYSKGGELKNRYENVGRVMENDDGHRMLLLKRSFNPAGVPHKDDSDSIIVNVFDRREGSEPQLERAPGRKQQPVDDDSIPF